MKLGLERKALAVAGLLLLGIVALVVLSLQAQSQLRHDVGEFDHAREVQTQTQRIHITLLDLETSQRGFLLTSDPPYLAPYRAGLERLRGEVDRLAALASDQDEMSADIAKLRGLIDAKLDELARILALAQTRGIDAALARLRGNQGKSHMDAIRVVLAHMDSTEAAARTARDAERTESINRTERYTALLAGAISLLLLTLAVLVRRDRAMRTQLLEKEMAGRQELERRVKARTLDLETASQALSLATVRLKGIFDSATDAIVTVNAQQVIVAANASAATLFQYAVKDLVGAPLERLIPVRFRAAHRRDVESFGAGGGSARQMGRTQEVMGTRADGTEFPVDASISQVNVRGERLYTVILRDITAIKRAQHDLAASRTMLQQLLANQHRIQEEERTRIARELHDDLQQSLAAIRMDAVAAGERLANGRGDVQALLTRIDGLSAAAISSTRRIVSDLRPEMLEELGLVAALEAMCVQHEERTGTRCRLELLPGSLEAQLGDSAMSTGLYRIAQEALNNVAKHAKATSVSLRLGCSHDGLVMLRISDDGIGMTFADKSKRGAFGLQGMAERARALGGQLRIEGGTEAGTSIEVLVPTYASVTASEQPSASGDPSPIGAAAPASQSSGASRSRQQDELGQPLQAVIDALAGHVSVLDRQGVINMVNRAWRDFAARNGDPGLLGCGPGVNYLDVCRRSATTDPTALPILKGMQEVLEGRQAVFSAEYPCDTPDAMLWFRMHVASVTGGMAIVTHVNLSGRVGPEDRASGETQPGPLAGRSEVQE